MLKIFKKNKKNNKGFTLVELVVVVAILAILVGLLAPQYTKYVEKARRSSDASNLENMVRAVEIGIADPDDTKRVKPGKYTITIAKKADSSATATTTVEVSKLDEADAPNCSTTEIIGGLIGEVIDSWEKTTVKSSTWDGDKISATITVQKDGAFSVTYSPKEFADMIGKQMTA